MLLPLYLKVARAPSLASTKAKSSSLAKESRTLNPMLCRVSAYLGPILPRPAMRNFFMGSVSCKWGPDAPKSLLIRFSTPILGFYKNTKASQFYLDKNRDALVYG